MIGFGVSTERERGRPKKKGLGTGANRSVVLVACLACHACFARNRTEPRLILRGSQRFDRTSTKWRGDCDCEKKLW